MDFEKIRNDYKKRYGRDCSNIYFAGKPLTFFSRPASAAGCAVSVGGAVALSRRCDDRFVAEFSDNSDYFSCNLGALPEIRDNEILRLLTEIKKLGISPGGAELLIYRNTDLPRNFPPLFLTALGGFCDNAPPVAELIKYFPNYTENRLCIASRADRLTVLDGNRCSFYPLRSSQVKIILCRVCGGFAVKNRPSDSSDRDAIDRLHRGDLVGFGKILTRETERILRLNKCGKADRLFRTAVRLGDAYGYGIFGDGGIFAVVDDSRADTFMQRLGAEYETHFGARPDFYVTRAESSGIEIRT